MPIQKFRTFDDARRALWLQPDDRRILSRMKRLAEMARSRRTVERGVTRFRTLDEAKRGKGAAWQVRPDLSGLD
jgi:hypothetical protein